MKITSSFCQILLLLGFQGSKRTTSFSFERVQKKTLILFANGFFSTYRQVDGHSNELNKRNIIHRMYGHSIFHLSQQETQLGKKQPMVKKMKDPDSYGKLSAEAYGIWFPENQDYEDAAFFEKYIKRNHGQPALEIGCGDGRLLIPYVKQGLKVEGVDFSGHMLERCRVKGNNHSLKLTLYQQSMQKLNIPKKYGTLFIPFGSFMLMHEKTDACEALTNFYHHLQPKGSLIISLFILTKHDIHVSVATQNEWRLRREGIRTNGTTIQCWEKTSFDLDQQIQYSECRYDVLDQNEIIATEHEMLKLRWYTQEQFRDMLSSAGFIDIRILKGHTDEIASPEDVEFTFVCQKP